MKVSGSLLLVIVLLCETVCAQTPKSASAFEEREKAVKLDLIEAVQMLENGQYFLFSADFLSGQFNAGYLNSSAARRTRSVLSPDKRDVLLLQLKSAVGVKPAFNRTRTLAQIDCVLKPVEKIPEKEPETSTTVYGKTKGELTGFGSDLSSALDEAAGTLDAGNTEKFIRGMFPLAELSRLTQSNQLDRLVFRLNSHPEMVRTMIRDLQQAAAAKSIAISGTDPQKTRTAAVHLPPTAKGSTSREFHFELINGHWRFADSLRSVREEHKKLLSAPVAGYSIPGSKLTLLLRWEDDSWKLLAPPAVQVIPADRP